MDLQQEDILNVIFMILKNMIKLEDLVLRFSVDGCIMLNGLNTTVPQSKLPKTSD